MTPATPHLLCWHPPSPSQADTAWRCLCLGKGDHVHPSLAAHTSCQPCVEGHGRFISKLIPINYHATECYVLPGGRSPKLGTIKVCFPSVYDAFQLPDLLPDSLVNPNVGYMDNHAPLLIRAWSLPLVSTQKIFFTTTGSSLVSRYKMWETSSQGNIPPTPPKSLPSSSAGKPRTPRLVAGTCLFCCSLWAVRWWFSCSRCSTHFWISSCCLQASEST